MRIVGVDPGTARIGYALINGSAQKPLLECVETIEIIRAKETRHPLAALADELTRRFERDRPDAIAIEKLFFTKNQKTALSVAEARGVILLTASRSISNIGEYTPSEVKLAVTGDGRADKGQIARMMRMIFPEIPAHTLDDALDAVAIAFCGLGMQKLGKDPLPRQ
jgi:crossover junction endodeoxyribonuclease RuvC